MSQMRMVLVAPALPPQIDGIGDYSARLAEELACGDYGIGRVAVLTGDTAAREADPIPGVAAIRGAFDPNHAATADRLLDAIIEDRPDWVLLQYNPFSFGRRGLNLNLPRAMADVGRRLPGTRLAVMFHEQFVPVVNWRFAVMTTWQRWQFLQLGRAADVLFCSMSAYAERCRRWFAGKPVMHLPVGSNIPRVKMDRDEARKRLGIDASEVVLAVFGNAHISRSFETVAAAVKAVREGGHRPRVLYIGPDGADMRVALGDSPTAITEGPLPAEEVSRRLSAADLALSSYSDGVSTRRGAMMATLQHGLAVIGTDGINTDPELRAANGSALLLAAAGDNPAFAAAVRRLADDPAERARVAAGGLILFNQRYGWPAIAGLMIKALTSRAE